MTYETSSIDRLLCSKIVIMVGTWIDIVIKVWAVIEHRHHKNISLQPNVTYHNAEWQLRDDDIRRGFLVGHCRQLNLTTQLRFDTIINAVESDYGLKNHWKEEAILRDISIEFIFFKVSQRLPQQMQYIIKINKNIGSDAAASLKFKTPFQYIFQFQAF